MAFVTRTPARGARRRLAAAATALATAAVWALGAAQADPTELTLVWRGNDAALKALQGIVDPWAAAHDAKVTVLAGEGDWNAYYDKYATQIAAGVPVDVGMLDMQAIPLGAQGAFIDLTPYIRRDGVGGEVPPISLAAYTVKGSVYGFPTDLFPNVVYYNQDLFDRAGLGLPPSDWQAKGWTWDEFAQDAKLLTLTDAGGKRIQWGSHKLAARAGAIVASFGGHMVTKDQTFDFKDPNVQNALNFIYHLLIDDKVEPQAGEDAGGGWNPFPVGHIGMEYTGTWQSAHLVNAPFKWNVAVTPMAATRTAEVTINALGIGRTSQHKELAWELIRFLTTDPAASHQFALQVATGIPATRRGQIDYLQQQRDLFPGMNAQVAVDALAYGVLDPFRLTVEFRKLADVKKKSWDAAFAGQMPLANALEQLKTLGDPLLAAGR
ncbi:MAG TPA: extracellular solute-binding protein [Limnochordia bacterium]|nr:extracellular solute-binding protein [Limnochordia bacterium]